MVHHFRQLLLAVGQQYYVHLHDKPSELPNHSSPYGLMFIWNQNTRLYFLGLHMVMLNAIFGIMQILVWNEIPKYFFALTNIVFLTMCLNWKIGHLVEQ